MAFRPGTVDLPEAGVMAPSAAIDDPRYFAHMETDYDFPELADTAFAQNMLTQYDELRTARGRTITSQRETTQKPDRTSRGAPRSPSLSSSQISREGEESLLDIPGPLPGEEDLTDYRHHTTLATDPSSHLSLSLSLSPSHRVSDIGLMREGTPRSSMISQSLGQSVGKSLMTSGMELGLEDTDLPPFDSVDILGEDLPLPLDALQPFNPIDDSFSNIEPISRKPSMMSATRDSMLPLPLQSPQLSDDTPVTGKRGRVERERERDGEKDDSFLDLGQEPIERGEEEREKEREETGIKDRDREKESKIMRGGKQKRSVPVMDDKVEISGRDMKRMLDDRKAILRRVPGEELILIRDSEEREREKDEGIVMQMLQMPCNRGLCDELQSLFSLTMTTHTLPFPPLPSSPSLSPVPKQTPDMEREKEIEKEEEERELGQLRSERERESMIEKSVEEERERERERSKRMSVEEAMDIDLGFGVSEYDNMIPMDESALLQEDIEREREKEDERKGEILSPIQFDEEPPFPPRSPEIGEGMELEADQHLWMEHTDEREKEKEREAEGGVEAGQWNERTRRVAGILKNELKKESQVSFLTLTQFSSRHTAAACFLEVLQLTTWGRLHVHQKDPFTDIAITSTALLEKDMLV
eukprot:CAMPEP_0182423330 /NCGR_PEP_ID=MMETSP1167-20130531/9284_1 /TAXON_ID=2988 /ORGANISM="Mallomonas Sp, Strain CCMP3275" /LENGTH=642 /DNA_ID=CAMNT_0024602183 /DNA_START=193 /DNA_END=2124 /DNA_ORIENTATION=+